MTLTTHAITGATLAALIPSHPVAGFLLGFASHFVLDAIPHWDYIPPSFKRDEKDCMNNDFRLDKDFIKSMAMVGSDFFLGFFVSLVIFSAFLHLPPFTILCGAFGAVLPDGLQFVYMKWRHEPLVTLQHFHTVKAHSKNESLNGRPLLGISLQLVVVLLAIIAFSLVRSAFVI